MSLTKTKIVATIGPAIGNEDMLEKLMFDGVDVFRVNFSHGDHEAVGQWIRIIKKLNLKHQRQVSILCDLQGPKLRIGEVENNGITLTAGQEISFITTPCVGTTKQLYMSYKEFPMDVNPGEIVLIDDGKFKLEVLETNRKDWVKAKVIYGGWLTSKKGVNLPNTIVSLPSLTEKDMADALFAIQHGVDWIGLSFVRKASDLKSLKKLIHEYNKPVAVLAKIEKPEALKELDDIIEEADGIMVARGDLGVEVPFDKVPMIQKTIVKKCLAAAKPVIIATQMLESMIGNFRPTRAEANDVANSVMDGADAIMLSGETSVGAFPQEAVLAMKDIAHFTEKNGFEYEKMFFIPDKKHPNFIRDSICFNAFRMASQMNVKAIIVFTNSGYTAERIASYRPDADIYAFTNNPDLASKLALLWGTHTFYYPHFENVAEVVTMSINRLKEERCLNTGDLVLHVGSVPINKKGSANMIRVSEI